MVAEVSGPASTIVRDASQTGANGPNAGVKTDPGPAAKPGTVVSLTADAARLLALEQAIAETPAIDERRVTELRDAIASGRYTVDAERTAARLIAFEAAHPDRGGD
jgi:negative regulator of flagellin synthesis FlgM